MLPTEVVDKLCKPPDLEAIPLISIDEKGFPHVALLSYFELIYQDQSLCFFLASSSRSTRFLQEHSRCALVFVDSHFVYYVKGSAFWLGDSDSQSIFRIGVESVLEDVPLPEEGRVFLKTGIQIGSSRQGVRNRLRLREKVRRRIRVWFLM